MRSRKLNPARRDLWYGAALLAVVALVVVLVAGGVPGRIDPAPHATAQMDDVGAAVGPGADVKMRGVVVGRVTGIGGTPGHLDVRIALERRALPHVPADVAVRVLPATVFGTSFLDLVVPVGARTAPHLTSGAVLPQDMSAPTLELQRALDGIDSLVKALGPAQLSAVLHALAGSLDGRGKDIGSTIDGLDHVLSVLNPKAPLLREDARLLAVNMRTLEQVAPDLLDGLDATADVAHGVTVHAAQARALLVAAIKLVSDGSSFLDATQVQLVRAILLSAGVSQAVYDNRTGISAQAKALDDLMTKILTAVGGSPGTVRVNIQLVNPDLYHYYTPADCPRYGSLAGSNCR
jgi:phospholipid/cholesterol/gamma-HCH transport system substrate-binding protein